MPDARPPVAIRITRPYTTEEEFLASELETLSRTSIFLVGAPSRPQGVVLRFEVALEGGSPLVRGEGRVMGYQESGFKDEPGLILRFTRLDTRSKALVDRAWALRSEPTAPRPIASPSGTLPVPAGPPAEPPSSPSIASFPSLPAVAVPTEPPASARVPVHDGARLVPTPSDRDDLLGRLRERAQALDSAQVREILERRAR